MFTNNHTAASGRGARLVQYSIAVAFIVMGSHAFAACIAPQPPDHIPSGNKATTAEMVAAQGSVKDFDAATNAYVACLQTEADAASAKLEQSESDPKKLDEKKKKLQSEQAKKQDAAVDKDKDVATRFNEQVRIFKAKNAKTE
jgi:hypothetical protein